MNFQIKSQSLRAKNNFCSKIFLFFLFFLYISTKSRNFSIYEDCTKEKQGKRRLLDPKTLNIDGLISLRKYDEEVVPVLNSNGDLFIESSESHPSHSVSFYALSKATGRDYFQPEYLQNELEKPPLNIVNVKVNKYYPTNLMVVNSNDTKEYLLSITYDNFATEGTTELYDFTNKKYFSARTSTIFPDRLTANKQSLIRINTGTASEYYYLLFSVNSKSYLSLNKFKLSFDSVKDSNSINIEQTVTGSKVYSNIEMVSCFQTENNYIEFFYLDKNGFKVNVYDENLNLQTDQPISIHSFFVMSGDEDVFYKCIHLNGEIGLFIYYAGINSYDPKLQILTYNSSNNTLDNYITEITENGENYVSIDPFENKYNLDNNFADNEIMKLTDTSFILVSWAGGDLAILLMDVYDSYKKLHIKYKEVSFYENYNSTLYDAVGLALYNGIITFTGVFQKHDDYEDDDYPYPGVVMFGYYTGKDQKIKIDSSSYTFKPSEHMEIVNNIFGYVIKEIQIVSITNPLPSGVTLNVSAPATFNESDTITITIDDSASPGLSFYIEYVGIAQEPTDSEYLAQFDITDKGSGNDSFIPPSGNDYKGRTNRATFYTCDASCNDCDEGPKNCIGCASSYNYFYELGEYDWHLMNCYEEIPDGYYKDWCGGWCALGKCDDDCLTCFDKPDNFSSNCASCKDPRFTIDEFGNCVVSEKCSDTKCLYCSEEHLALNRCDICNYDEGFYDIPNNNEEEVDYVDCYNMSTPPEGYFFDEEKEKFSKCHSDCKTCDHISDDNSTHCLNCSDSFKVLDGKGNCVCKNTKCSICDLQSDTVDRCRTCNNKDGFYQKDTSDPLVECFTKEETPKGYYFDDTEKKFKKCYDLCSTCEGKGNEADQKCITCIDGYFIDPDKETVKNCLLKCKYYYFYEKKGKNEVYSCSESGYCPINYNFLVRPSAKCTDDCSNDGKYKKKYSGECLETCPEGTRDSDNTCRDDPTTKCKGTTFDFPVPIDELNDNVINSLIKNYAKEFDYTEKHVSIYNNLKYTILIYNTASCLKELNIQGTTMDSDECIDAIKQKIHSDSVIIVSKGLYNNGKLTATLDFYHPELFYKIEKAAQFCKGIKTKISTNINSLGLDQEMIVSSLALQELGVNITDPYDPFFQDVCFHLQISFFEKYKDMFKNTTTSSNETLLKNIFTKDMALKDRRKYFYNGAQICFDGCEILGFNKETGDLDCNCEIEENTLFKICNYLGGENWDLIQQFNVGILKCTKDFRDKEYWKTKSYAYIIFMLIFLGELAILFVFIFIYKNELEIILKKATDMYCNNNGIKSDSDNKEIPDVKKPMKELPNPPNKKEEKIKVSDKNDNSENKRLENNSINSTKVKDNDKNDDELKSPQSDANLQDENIKNLINNNENDFSEFLEENNKKAPFGWKFFLEELVLEKIKENIQIVNIILVKDYLIPWPVKLFNFLARICFTFLVNGLLYTEEDISKLFSEEEGNFIKRNEQRFINNSLITLAYKIFITLFIPGDGGLATVFEKVEKKTPKNLKDAASRYFLKIRIFYYIGFGLNLIISFFTFYFSFCFSSSYPNTVNEWIATSFGIYIITELIALIRLLLKSVCQLIALKTRIESIYKFGEKVGEDD